MTEDCLVSIIIPVHNSQMYLKECIDSVVSQTLKGIEIICVNDGSTDDSLSILNKYANQYDNIIILSQENQGTGIARNNGIRRAQGKYLIFMDSDDFYPTSDCLEALYNVAEDKNVSICGGIIVGESYGEKRLKKAGGGEKAVNFSQIGLLKTSEYPTMHGHVSYLFRTDLIKKNNIYYSPYRRFEDPPFMLKAIICAGERYGIDKVVYNYRSGHKEVRYSLQDCVEILSGIRDVIKLSKEHDLTPMYDDFLKNINNQYAIAFYQYSFCGHKEIDNVIEEINEMIREWIGENEGLIVTKEAVHQVREDCQKEYENFLRILHDDRKKIVYGAGMKSHTLIEHHKNDIKNVIGVAITEKQDGSDDFLTGLPIQNIEYYLPYKKDALVMITTMLAYQSEIEQNLKRLGFKNIMKLDVGKLDLAWALRGDESEGDSNLFTTIS